jgi:CBS domain-containing protein
MENQNIHRVANGLSVPLIIAMAIVALFLQTIGEEFGWVIHRGPLSYLAFLAFWTVMMGAVVLWRPGRLVGGVFAAAIVLLVLFYYLPTSETQRFLKDLQMVEAGMTVAEVEQVMGGYMKGTGWPALADEGESTLSEVGSTRQWTTFRTSEGEMAIKNTLVYRYSNSAANNSSWGLVYLEDGRVVGIDFAPD